MDYRFTYRRPFVNDGACSFLRRTISFLVFISLPLVIAISLLERPAFGGREMTDSDIRELIEARVVDTIAVAGDGLTVHVRDGVVMLSGSVANLLQQDQIHRIAESILGVRSVVDNVRLELSFRDDEDIAEDVRRALSQTSLRLGSNLFVTVDGGVVTLTGIVDSWVLNRMAARQAMSIRGVSSVVNRIDVQTGPDREDQAIQQDVKRRLAADLYIDATRIDVSVRGGHVILAGMVSTLAEKHRAAQSAWIAGVIAVNDQGLAVRRSKADRVRRSSPYIPQPDRDISRAIEDALIIDPRVNAFNPEVAVVDGVVTLSGVVDTLYAKRAAEADALNTTGVWKVDNQLRLRYRAFPSTDEIKRLIDDVLQRDAELHALDINVHVDGNHVTLTGSVDRLGQKIRAENIISQIDGVLTLDSRLRVDATSRPAGDDVIAAAIDSQLYWSPYVDSDRIDVSVVHATAVLTGRVTNRFVARIAVQNAFEGGARTVRTHLVLKDGSTLADQYDEKPRLTGLTTPFWQRL
jgi:osmotically-inducible protein OsmY